MISTNYTNNQRNRRKLYGIAGAFATLAIPLIISFQHNGHQLENAQSYCPFKMLTGFPCPGCGITKSMVFAYERNITKCLQYHVLGPVVIAVCIGTILLLLTELYTGKEYFNRWIFNRKLAYTLGILLAVYHIARIVVFIQHNSWEQILQQSIWR